MAKPSHQNKFSKHHYMPLLAAIEVAFLISFWVTIDYGVVYAPPSPGSPLMNTYNISLPIAIIFAIIILGLTMMENNSLLKVFAILNILSVIGASLAGLAFNASGFNNLPVGEVSGGGDIFAMIFTWFILFYAIRK